MLRNILQIRKYQLPLPRNLRKGFIASKDVENIN